MARVIIPEATSGKCFTHKEVFFRPSATVRLYYWPKLKVQLAKMIKVIENCRWRPKRNFGRCHTCPLLATSWRFFIIFPTFYEHSIPGSKVGDEWLWSGFTTHFWVDSGSLSWTCWISEIWPALLEISYSAEKQQQNVIERWDLRLKI